MLHTENISLDKIDNALECARLRLQRTYGHCEPLKLAAEYGRIPVGSVGGLTTCKLIAEYKITIRNFEQTNTSTLKNRRSFANTGFLQNEREEMALHFVDSRS